MIINISHIKINVYVCIYTTLEENKKKWRD